MGTWKADKLVKTMFVSIEYDEMMQFNIWL